VETIEATFKVTPDGDAMTFSQAAKMLNVRPGTVRYYAHKGKLPVIARFDGLALVAKAAVQKLLLERNPTANAA
jgi:predicted site-specific integrase-resolvase